MKVALGFFVCMLFATVAFSQITVTEKVEVFNPVQAESKLAADVYFWKTDATTKYITVGGGKQVHIWAPPGKHTLGLVTVSVDVKTPPDWKPGQPVQKDIKYNEYTTTFEITGVGPTPIDPVVPVIPTTPFKDQIKAALTKVSGQGLQSKANVGNIYLKIAKEAESKPASWDAATMVNEVKTRATATLPISVLKDWQNFWPAVSTAFKDLKLASTDLNGHIKAFKDVAEVLIQ